MRNCSFAPATGSLQRKVDGPADCYYFVTMDDISSERLAGYLATNLREAREQRRLTQNRLAELSRIPRSTLASIETGSSNPTLAILSRLSAALQVSLEELLTAPRSSTQLFPHGSLPVLRRGKGSGVSVAKLLPDPIPGMEIDRMELPPGTRMAGTPHRRGTREYLVCESGAIATWVDGERFELQVGDLLAFPGDCRHSYGCVGPETAVGFSVVVLAPAGARQ